VSESTKIIEYLVLFEKNLRHLMNEYSNIFHKEIHIYIATLKRISIFIILSFYFTVTAARAENLQPDVMQLDPMWSFENGELEKFLITFLQIYEFYGTVSNKEPKNPNFLFVSGDDYIRDQSMNLEKVGKFFPRFNQEIAEYFKGNSESCLVFRLKLDRVDTVIGISDTEKEDIEASNECVLEALSFFVGDNVYPQVKGNDFEETSRNLIDFLRSKYNG